MKIKVIASVEITYDISHEENNFSEACESAKEAFMYDMDDIACMDGVSADYKIVDYKEV